MKALIISSLLSFCVGILFRLLHFPGGALFSIAPIFLLLGFAVANTKSKKKVWGIDTFGGWVVFAWALFVVFKYMHWYTGPLITGFSAMFLVVLSLTLLYVILARIGKLKQTSKVAVIIALLGFTYSFVPAYASFYFFHLNSVFNKERKQTNYYAWDKYSWFLYQQGKKQEALEANEKAVDAWHKRQEQNAEPTWEESHLNVLKLHKQEITNGQWTSGPVSYGIYYP